MSSKAINLYRSILRAHRQKFPSDLRTLGNAYVRNEFQLHKKVTSQDHLKQFFNAWENYVVQLENKAGSFGRDLDKTEKDNLSADQKEKLTQIRQEAESAKQT